MLNRRHIRIKIMQTIYAFNMTESGDIKKLEKFLSNSLEDMYGMHICILELLFEIHKKAEDYLGKTQKKFLPSKEDMELDSRFIDNKVLLALRNNKLLQEKLKDEKKNYWYLDFEYVDIIFKEILKSEVYKAYRKLPETNFNADRNFIIDLYTEVIATNDQLFDYFEDKKLTWVDDFPVVNTNFIKVLRKLKPNSSDQHFFPPLFKDLEDREFAFSLLRKTVLNQTKYNEEISKKTKNWDSERIAKTDFTLLKMAICEFQEFPSIPYKVSINEYLEISKEYSTPKSSIFINGILDKIVKEYKSEGSHKKVGRGLL